MKNIKITYFVHGTTTDNENSIATGQAPGELSALGIKQSLELRQQIKGGKFDVVFSSDLKRAIDSTNLMFPNTGIIQDKRLRECDYGDLTGAKDEKIDSFLGHDIDKPFPNGESCRDVERRIRDFLDNLLKKYFRKNIAIVSHKAPQLALDVILKGKTWKEAIAEDWRKSGGWQPGWEYLITEDYYKLNKELEDILRDEAVKRLEKGKPGWDVPHTLDAVDWMKKLIRTEGGNEKILLTAMYLHDIGYPVLREGYTFDEMMEAKKIHAENGAKEAGKILKTLGFSGSDVEEICHLVRNHDKRDNLNTLSRILVFEADSLAQINWERVKPMFDKEGCSLFLDYFKKRRVPEFRTETGKKMLEELLKRAEDYMKEW